MQEMWVLSLGWEDPLKEEMATWSSILARKIPWTEEPCGLQSMGPQRVWKWLENARTRKYIQCLLITDNGKRSEIHIYNCITLGYTWNGHNIVNQLYFFQKPHQKQKTNKQKNKKPHQLETGSRGRNSWLRICSWPQDAAGFTLGCYDKNTKDWGA